MDCPGCERTIRKKLSKVKGIHSIEVDLNEQKVSVMGYVDRHKVLNKVRRTGKRAEFWPYPEEAVVMYVDPYTYTHGTTVLTTQSYGSNYNYREHGYSDTASYEYGRFHARPDDGVSSVFSDENPNACSIM